MPSNRSAEQFQRYTNLLPTYSLPVTDLCCIDQMLQT